ncbi:HAD-superfamily hydrolase [Candidatus Rhodobacter oscarellae]|uniref:HAD-superfamily hydrolase n=1 Tax=Candidatus Rhodobacter oscarellae TaxID=1675527 RepID=A0A0J9E3Z1_9RHOB|nr:HAD family phosphatase [Candidatus Rhodobacter lobularis]KMW57505.1 HAD-superfamily hydrolase [Candidatus Rhodobacter lobularis]
MAEFDAILFDMDGLLLDTERVYLDCGIEALSAHGISEAQARALFLSLVGVAGAQADALIAEALPPSVDAGLFIQDWMAAVERFLAIDVPLCATVAESLAALSKAGWRMAVVTSTSGKRARHHLQMAGIADHFEAVIGGDEVAANKPDPAPYLAGADVLGVEATRCVAFEDSDPGITAAVRAGCTAVQVPGLRPPGAPLPRLGQIVASNLRAGLTQLGLLA